ncbi:hypothetical protein STENM327S_08796 [Streptomyces tendae]
MGGSAQRVQRPQDVLGSYPSSRTSPDPPAPGFEALGVAHPLDGGLGLRPTVATRFRHRVPASKRSSRCRAVTLLRGPGRWRPWFYSNRSDGY